MITSLAEAAALNPLEHVLPHELFPVNGPHWITNQMLMATVAAVLMVIIFPTLFRRADPSAPKGARNFFESILEFLRIEVFRPALKEHTDRFLPFLWTLFFFILFCNLLGLLPIGAFFEMIGLHGLKHIGGTATGTVSTTGGLAVCAFFAIHVSGVLQVFRSLRDGTFGHHAPHEEHSANGTTGHESAIDQPHMRAEGLAADVPNDMRALGNPTGHYSDDQHMGPHIQAATLPVHSQAKMGAFLAAIVAVPIYLWNFAPHPFKPVPGKPGGSWAADLPIWAMLLVLELFGALIKPFALCIRLFANMIAGHIVLAALVLLIVMIPSMKGQVSVAIPVTLLSLLIYLLEIFVAFLQTYIFTFLTTLFIASAVAPEH